jgi:hypothetical protein
MTKGDASLAGNIYYFKAGTYSIGATATLTSDGTASDPICLIACDSSWNVVIPTRTGTGKLNTNTTNGTTCPHLSLGSGYYLNFTGSTYLIVGGFRIAADRNGSAVSVGDNSILYGCAVTNSYSNSSANCITEAGSYDLVAHCDAACTGGNSGSAIASATGGKVYYCLVYQSASYGITVGGSNAVIANNLIYGCSDYGVYKSSTTAAVVMTVLNNTVYGKGVGTANGTYTNLDVVMGNHCTDGSGYGFYSSGVSAPVALAFNRTRDNSSGAVSWPGTWDDRTTWQHVTDAVVDGPDDEFVSVTTGDFRLRASAAAVDKGAFGAIGASQLPAAVLPTVLNVWYGSGTYGYPWDTRTPTKRASSIPVTGGAGATLSAPDVKSGVVVDDVTGSYAGGGGGLIVVEDE